MDHDPVLERDLRNDPTFGAIRFTGYLFKYDEFGQPHGMVHDKKMVCVTS